MARKNTKTKTEQVVENLTLTEALAEEGKTPEDIKHEDEPKETKTSKMSVATAIYEDEWNKTEGKPVRKVLIKRFVEEAGLTEKGSSTYVFNIAKKYKTK